MRTAPFPRASRRGECVRGAVEARLSKARGSSASGGLRSCRTRTRRCRWSPATRAIPRPAGRNKFRDRNRPRRETSARNSLLVSSQGNHGACVGFWARKKWVLLPERFERPNFHWCYPTEGTTKPARYSRNALKSIGLVKQV